VTICVVHQDPAPEVETGQVCTGCIRRIAADLADIPQLYAHITLTPARRAAGPRVTGSHDAPLPLNVDALDLTLPARAGTIHDRYGDQTGHQSVAAVLDDWVRDWRDQRGRGEGLPVSTVGVLVGWLTVRLDEACVDHPAIDEFAADMRRLRRTLRQVGGDGPERPERLPAPCPRCDLLALVREGGYVTCRNCPEWLDEDGYAEWTRQLAGRMRRAA
jgi:hypothetical protein